MEDDLIAQIRQLLIETVQTELRTIGAKLDAIEAQMRYFNAQLEASRLEHGVVPRVTVQ